MKKVSKSLNFRLKCIIKHANISTRLVPNKLKQHYH